MKTTRRDFIKISSLGAGGVALTSTAIPLSGIFGKKKPALDEEKLTKIPTYCDICFWKCAGWAFIDEEGNIRKLEGNKDDLLDRGRLCPRGTGGIGAYYDDDRLKTPLIRTEENGEQVFKEATWEEALDLVANKMKEIKEKYGPESFALLKHGSPGKHFAHLFNAYGSNTIAEPAFAQCRGPRDVGFKLTFGKSPGSPECTDLRDAKCIVLIGSHIGENMHNSQVQELSDAIDNGVSIITVDPRLSTVANKSKFWLPIRPSTDMALLLSWMHVLIYEELYDKAYVDKNTTGFDELKKHVRHFTPEWAYPITDIKPEVIRQSAREMAISAPSTIIHPGRHVVWYGDDTQRSRALAILNALLGSWGRRGGFYNSEKMRIPKYPQPPYPKPKWDAHTLSHHFPFANHGVTGDVVKASIAAENTEHQVKAWMVAGTNLTKSVPGRQMIEKAISELEFLVVVDTMPMEITGYADVILPECTYLERYDQLRNSSWRTPSVAVRMPAVKPKYESKPAWWMAKQLGERLGLHDYFDYEDYEEVIKWQLEYVGTSLEEMKHLGVKNYDRSAKNLYMDEEATQKFNTPSGKIELYSQKLKDAGFDPLPVYIEHERPPKNYLRMIYGRAPMHTFSKTANNPYLNELKNENLLWINPRVAKKWNLHYGQKVWLKNQDGVISTFPIKVRLTERIRWDSIYMVHGFGHNNKKLTRAYGRGVSDTKMISKILTDPIMGGTGLRGNFVTILTEEPTKNIES